jgi:hypothetical protein
MIVAGMLLWANLRLVGWAKEFKGLPPEHLNAVTKSMFFRGWPLSPWMFCLVDLDQHYARDAEAYVPLVVDGVVFVVALLVVRGVSEFCFRMRTKPIIETPPRMPPPQSSPPPAGSTSGPRIE